MVKSREVKTPARSKRQRGRPESTDPKAVQVVMRFNPELIAGLDAWAKENGDLSRSAAIRQAVARMLRAANSEK